ncbi:MAG: LPS export ABC transporter permease LptF [Gammaproteobacteria bacterium]|nr:LPS export ABC transporter permease LptF [Gammaproteobacteria bacterium]
MKRNPARIIDRYLRREAFVGWIGVLGVLLAIILSHRFARFLGDAAAGKLPADWVFTLLGLSVVGFLGTLIPVALFLGLMTAFGRLYRDSEMTAMAACGVGTRQLYRPVTKLALLAVAILCVLSLYAGPWAAKQLLENRAKAEKEAEIGMFESGRFRTSKNGDVAFYAKTVNEDGSLEEVFVYRAQDDGEDSTVTARRGEQVTDPETGQRYLILENGERFDGEPGAPGYSRVNFGEHGILIRQSEPDVASQRLDGVPTLELLQSDELSHVAEWQWRISQPVMALLLALLSVPLSRTRPREGRYGRLVIGILIYAVYSNLLGVAQVWVEQGKLTPSIGLWGVHAFVALVLAWQVASLEGWTLRNWLGDRRAAA